VVHLRIESKKDYKLFLMADRVSLGLKNEKPQILPRNERQVIWKFQRLLRKVEYYTNTNKGMIGIRSWFYRQLYFRQQLKLGFNIPTNVFGPGLSIAHIGPIVVNSKAKVGANCRLHICTNIGMAGGNKNAATIGNNVYLGIGSKVIGELAIADGVVIGANSVVTKSILEEDITVAGAPAKKISDNGNPLPKERRGFDIAINL
jgi:serine O-acetyltransferase